MAAPNDGHGLGLMLAHGLVAAMGGDLTGRNSASGGAVFTLRLPRAEDQHAAHAAAGPAGRPAS